MHPSKAQGSKSERVESAPSHGSDETWYNGMECRVRQVSAVTPSVYLCSKYSCDVW